MKKNRGFVGTACSDVTRIPTTDDTLISTLVPLLESGTRGAASAASDVSYRASSVASPHGLSITGAGYDIRPILHVSPDQSAPDSFDVAVAGIVDIEDRVGCPPVRPTQPLVTPHPFIDEGPHILSATEAVAVASPSPALSNRSLRPTRAYRHVPVRSAFSAIHCTGRREAKRLMTSTTVVDVQVSSHSRPVSTGVHLPPRAAPSLSLYSTDDEVACLTGAKENVRPAPYKLND